MRKKGVVSEPLEPIEMKQICPQCGSSNVSFNLVLEEKKTGCGAGCFLTYVFIFLLILIPVLGWILLIAIFLEKKDTVNVTYALCQNCGHSWKLKQQKQKKHKKAKKVKK